MARPDRARKQISPTTSLIMVIGIGVVVGYLGISILFLAVQAFDKGETLIGLAALALGAVLVAGPVAVVVSQIRSILHKRH